MSQQQKVQWASAMSKHHILPNQETLILLIKRKKENFTERLKNALPTGGEDRPCILKQNSQSITDILQI